MQMEINTKEIGEMDRDGKMEFINTRMEMFMTDNGVMILNKVMVNLIWLLEINIKEIGKEAKRMEKVKYLSILGLYIFANGDIYEG